MTTELSDFAARLRARFLSRQEMMAGRLSNGARGTFPERSPDDDLFNQFALELFALQSAHNAPYRKFCEARGVTAALLNDWRTVPALPTTAFKEWELSCLPARERETVFYSSGTTTHRPSRHFHNAESLIIYEASLRRWFSDCVGRLDGMAVLTPARTHAPHSSLVYMFDAIRRDAGAPESVFLGRATEDGSWTLNFDETVAWLRQAADVSTPGLLLGTAFSFVHLLDHLGQQGARFRLPPGSVLMETGGYKGRSRTIPRLELHSLVTERLGIPAANIRCEYGMSELSSQAYDRQSSTLNPQLSTLNSVRTFRFPPWVRAQVISPETGREVGEGETGLLRVFDLANVFSVMAIQTEDLAIRRPDGFELIGRVEPAEPRGCSLMVTADSAFPIPHSALE